MAARWLSVGVIAYLGALATFEGPAEILCIALLLAVGLTGGLRLRLGAFEVGLLVWALAGCAGLLLYEGPVSSGAATRPLMALAALLGPAWVRAPAAAQRRWVLVFVLVVAGNAAYGWLQYFAGPFPWDRWFVSDLRSPQLFIPGRVFHELAASGTFYNRVRFAFVLLPAFVACAVVVGSSNLSRRRRVVAVALALFLAATLLLTHVRFVLVASLVSVFGLALFTARRRLLALTGGLLSGAVAVFLALGPLSQRALRLGADFEVRAAIFASAWKVIASHPLLGAGHGRYRLAVQPFASSELAEARLNSAHNLYLMVWAESGLLGLAGFAVAGGTAWWAASRSLKADLASRCAWAVMSSFLLAGVVHFSLHHASGALAFWTAAGIAVARQRQRNETQPGGALRPTLA